MATELGLLSLTHLHNLTQSQDNSQNQLQLNPNNNNTTSSTTIAAATTTTTTSSSNTIAGWMWNPSSHGHPAEDDDSWEVRAFAEDTGNVMGTTWPPRSYTCAFCRREFRSAQALGGHMNVHRRDRARLHQVISPPNSIINHPSAAAATAVAASNSSSARPSSSSFIIPTGEFVASGGGLCLVYQLQNPNGTAYACSEPPSFSPSPYLPRDLLRPAFSPSVNFPDHRIDTNSHRSRHDRQYRSRPAEEPSELADNNGGDEELDLELRLGHGPTPS